MLPLLSTQCEAMFEAALASPLGGEIKTNNFLRAKAALLQWRKESQRTDLNVFQIRPGVDDPDHTLLLLKMNAALELENAPASSQSYSGVMF